MCDTAYWVALLRYVGCTGHAHEVATVFGDEIAIRAQTLCTTPPSAEVMRDVLGVRDRRSLREERDEIVRCSRKGRPRVGGAQLLVRVRGGRHARATAGFRPRRTRSLAFTFERWNGKGFPAHAEGERSRSAMRVVHLSHDMEAIGRLFSPDQALDAARDRRDRTYDPALADLFVEHGRGWFERLDETEPWDAVLASNQNRAGRSTATLSTRPSPSRPTSST